MDFSVKWKGNLIGTTKLEKGDPPMGVALGEFLPLCAIENTLGVPLNKNLDICGWEGFDVFTPKNQVLECHSVYLEQYDCGNEGRVYQISCIGINAEIYSQYFQRHQDSYENSFN